MGNLYESLGLPPSRHGVQGDPATVRVSVSLLMKHLDGAICGVE